MAHPKDHEVWPVGTIVRLKKTHEFARIVSHTWLRPEMKKYFLHYSAEIEGREPNSEWCVIHDEADLECLPF